MKTKAFFIVFCFASFFSVSSLQAATNVYTEMKTVKPLFHDYQEIHTEELKKLLDSGKNFLILDARAKEYEDHNRLPGAHSLPPNTPDKVITSMIPNKDTFIVVYCTNAQCPASQSLAGKLVKLGYTHVYKYPEGIQGWMDHGYPIDHVYK